MKSAFVLLLSTLACCCSSASSHLCPIVQDIMSLILHGSQSDVKSALEENSASILAKAAIATLKASADTLSLAEKDGFATLVEKMLEKC